MAILIRCRLPPDSVLGVCPSVSSRADVNNVVKRLLDVRKASFLSTERAVEESGMEQGGITPVGLPAGWRLLVDSRVPEIEHAIIGSGVRR